MGGDSFITKAIGSRRWGQSLLGLFLVPFLPHEGILVLCVGVLLCNFCACFISSNQCGVLYVCLLFKMQASKVRKRGPGWVNEACYDWKAAVLRGWS